ncbi:MAG: adenylate/guanylate cyclase domain-containing protein [Gammaproteobacteria bacterium]|nr:adenylate/guanylate cyclase domain-containing protein [Gammaproteobacteria bacterium]
MNKRIPILLGFILIILAVWLQISTIESIRSFILRLDNVAYDMQLRARIFTHFVPPSSPIAIIDIDDKSLKAVGRWPWPRSEMAELINALTKDGVVVIATDIMFSESQINIVDTILQELNKKKLDTPSANALLKQIQPDLNDDKEFADSLKDKDIVLGMTFVPNNETSGELPPPLLTLSNEEKKLDLIQWKGYIGNIPIIQSATQSGGFINVLPDPDGIIRRVPLIMRYQDNAYPSLALAAVKLFLLGEVKLDTAEYNNSRQLESLKLGNHIIPTNAQGELLISFVGKSYSFPFYSASDVLSNKISAGALAGKIVFIGTSATGLGDLRATAIEGVFPGVEIQATIADSILQDHYSYRPAWTQGAEVMITILLGIILALIYPYLGPRSLTLFSIAIPLASIFLNNWFWEKTGLIIFVLVPILLAIALAIMNMVYGYVFETRRRERLKEMFGQYVPEKHIDEMLKATGTYALHGEDREMTVLFADIRNFTSISEPMTATELKDMLNQFFTPMTEIIFNHKGTIDKYIGDLIMAFWGAPLKDKRHAQHAISSALDMQEEVEKLKPVFAARGWAEINIGIGLNTGTMSVGDMGSKFRRNYTVLGDSVNLGSRVESLTKHYGVKIMVTEATQQDQSKFLFRQLDRVKVKGKKLGVSIYEVIGRQIDLSDEVKNEIALSDRALNYYFNQQWDDAETLFAELHTAHPTVKLYSLYLERIEGFKQNLPPSDWDGVFAHANK